MYPLIEVILIALRAIMSGAEAWEDYGHAQQSWLQRCIPLAKGIPRHDVFRRVFCRLIPQDIERCFMTWVQDMKRARGREVIAVEGKTMRGSADKQGGIKGAHLVKAWATENRMVVVPMKPEDQVGVERRP